MNTLPLKHPKHVVDTLRDDCLAQATRDYKARGIKVKRCPNCQLSQQTCICASRENRASQLEFVLLFHSEEIYKPTNTGRLIADLFPNNCHAFIWSRTEPSADLQRLLQDPKRDCYLLFPPRENDDRPNVSAPHQNEKITTLVILDGSWKQARKMYSQSHWLKDLPALHLTAERIKGYQLRQSHEQDYLATCEAVGLAIETCGEPDNSHALLNYFQLFNRHYVAMRQNRDPNL